MPFSFVDSDPVLHHISQVLRLKSDRTYLAISLIHRFRLLHSCVLIIEATLTTEPLVNKYFSVSELQ
ncbi:hypothetical protein L6452_12152 [Arctium lappa]|uniref:Uncharacterized protein n=1 Tax=Arctium lappa TaxID=4217 RepID=A0ACB9DR62_ARCLA|nr:hypothetical protein L6452_12152 [Arctium lappa]